MENFKNIYIFSPFAIGHSEHKEGLEYESLKTMIFKHASELAEASVGKSILEKGIVTSHNDSIVLACCSCVDNEDNKRFFIATSVASEADAHWVQNMSLEEVDDINQDLNSNK